ITDLTHSGIVDVNKFISLTNVTNGKCFVKQQMGFIINYDPNDIYLTSRQSECLFFIIRGKTSKEISQLLNISMRTVEDHTDHLKNKFNCKTKSVLIDKAIFNGYLNRL